uniref:Uncharacterized protein n=1 Tax=Rhizophora mucronata TaxID=61149 RepID=A0A2P2QGD0_RHIMU
MEPAQILPRSNTVGKRKQKQSQSCIS